MDGSQAYKLTGKKRGNKEKKRGLERSFGNDRGCKMAGSVRSLIANHVTGFKNSYFWTC
jgi:ribosomal protein L6P/L9E